jgi:hypothetical protein
MITNNIIKSIFLSLGVLVLTQTTYAQRPARQAPAPVVVKPNPAYRVESIEMPDGLSAETGAINFMPDGRLIACFHRGEVMTYTPATKKWKLFASGVHDPLGIMVINNNEILLMQRPELTRIKDTDGDGVADEYLTITDDYGISGNYHEFAFGPVKDKQGNLFISLNTASNQAGIRKEPRGGVDTVGLRSRMFSAVSYRGWVLKLSPDGKLTPYASGFRSPNGLGFDLKGNLLVPDNQGDWLGTSHLYVVKEGKFYGHPASLLWTKGWSKGNPALLPVAELDKMRTRPAVEFPNGLIANSPTQPLCDTTNGKFGPFAGQIFLGEMNKARINRVMLEEVAGELQGACIPFLDELGLRKGNNRLVFATDGSLWTGQTDHGWAGDKGIQRIVFTGATPMDILNMSLTKQGFDLTFTQPVSEATANSIASYAFKRYYYEYHAEYGSKQFDITPVPVTNVKLSADRKQVSLTLAELKPGYIYQLDLTGIKSANGVDLQNSPICYTLNNLR